MRYNVVDTESYMYFVCNITLVMLLTQTNITLVMSTLSCHIRHYYRKRMIFIGKM